MNGRVEVVNRALGYLGEGPIQSMDEKSVPANSARLIYDSVRRAVLREFNWSFAIKLVTLARMDETPPDYRFAYTLPFDCVKVLRPRRPGVPSYIQDRDIMFEVRGNTLFATETPLMLEYIADVPDETMFDDLFAEAFAYKLASELAMPVAQSPSGKESNYQLYLHTVGKAAAVSGRETKDSLSGNPYVEAR